MENEYINAERSESRELRKAWIELDDKRQELERKNIILREALEKFRNQFDCYECTGTAEEALDSLENAKKSHAGKEPG